MEHLSTERLRFRGWTGSDFPAIAEYFSDEKLSRYVGGLKTPEEAWRLMATYIGHYQLKGYSYMAVVEKESELLVGTVGLWNSEPWPEMELGYWLLPSMQGKGYGLEAATKVKEFAFQELGVETLVSYIDPKNQPSIRLAERLGGKLERTIKLLEYGDHMVYRYYP